MEGYNAEEKIKDKKTFTKMRVKDNKDPRSAAKVCTDINATHLQSQIDVYFWPTQQKRYDGVTIHLVTYTDQSRESIL